MAQIIGDEFDNILKGTPEADTIDGAQGFDTVTYQDDAGAGGTAGVVVNLSATSQTVDGVTVSAGTALDGFGNVDTLLGIEAVRGTASADIFFSGNGSGGSGTGSNTFYGFAGNDDFYGSGGQSPDTVDYSLDVNFGATHGIKVNMRANTIQGNIEPDTVQGSFHGSFDDTDYIPGIRNITGTLFRDEIYGGGNANVLNAGAGDDLVEGGDGDDRIIGGQGTDQIDGGNGDDTIIGGQGADQIDGGNGVDTLDYGAEGGPLGIRVNLNGIETQIGLGPDQADDSFGDRDTVTRVPNVIGTSHDDRIYGGNHENDLRGEAGNDELLGGVANDRLDGGAGEDTVRYYGNRADYQITRIDYQITGITDGFQVVDLNTASSPPDGPSSVMDEGTDTVIDVEWFHFADQTISAAQLFNQPPGISSNGGGDTAAVTVLENGTAVTIVTATDPDADALTFTISGGADGGRFTIDGQTGALSFTQAPDFENPTDADGDNVYDVIVAVADGNGGADTQAIAVTVANVAGLSPPPSNAATIVGTGEDDVLTGLGGANALLGLAGNDILNGGGGNDTLDGGAGADAMNGGAGNDTYLVDNAADRVIENNGGGTDTVRTVLATYSLATLANVENLTFTGEGDFNGTGNGLANVITGGNGNDTLDGGAGNDRMVGGLGDDVYRVGSASDVVVEQTDAGTDLVLASVRVFELSANVENLTFIGTGSFLGIGNGAGNVVTGGTGNDLLDGRGGDDRLEGGAGADLLDGGGGNDLLSGGACADTLLGQGGSDLLEGGLGNDLLVGGGGADRLVGGAGNDVLTGGSGNDTFFFNLPTDGLDTITDFAAGRDKLVFSSDGFEGLVSGQNPVVLTAASVSNVNQPGTDGRFIFDNVGADAGTIYWDANGGMGSDAVAVARLIGVTTLQATDLAVL